MPELLTAEDQARLDTPFPRGGGSEVLPLDIKKANVEATRDVYEQHIRDDTNKIGKKRKRTAKKVKPTEIHTKTRIEPFLMTKIKVGTLVLGQIENVANDELVMSLPNSLVGFVDLDDAAEHYRAGNWLRCIVEGIGEAPYKRLQLSISPDVVNQTIAEADWRPGMSIQARVLSVEDKGSVLDLGGGKSGFTSNTDLVEGQVVLGSIQQLKSRVIVLDTKNIGHETKELETVESQASLVPGCMVEARVTEVRRDAGMVLELFGHIKTTVDKIHELKSATEDDVIKARVLFSHPAAQNGSFDRQLGLTGQPHSVNMEVDRHGTEFRIGQIVDSARVVSIVAGVGMILELSSGVHAFAHVSRLRDEHVPDDSPEFKIGTEHRARIISFGSADQLYQVTLNPRIIGQRYLTIEDIQPGDVVKDATVDRILSRGGVVISLGRGLNALASELHLSDVKLANPEKRLKPGQKVAVRILDVQPELHRISVTLKKSLVNSEDSLLITYGSAATIDSRTPGTIVAFKNRGATVEFFGGVLGLLPLSEMSEASIGDPQQHFRLGQTISVRVLQVVPETRRLIVSCRAPHSSSLSIGQVVDATVSSRDKKELRVLVGNDEMILPVYHLADDRQKVNTIAKDLIEGRELKVRVISPNQVTAKPSMLQASPLSTTDELARGQSYAGFVSGKDLNHGLFVTLASVSSRQLVGLIPVSELPKESSKWPIIGDSVTPRVTSIKENRFYLTLSSSKASAKDPNTKPEPGDIVSAVVTTVKQTQINVTVNGDFQGRVDVSQLWDSYESIPDPLYPLATIKRGQCLHNLQVLGFHDARNHRFLPLSHRGGSHLVLELSAVSTTMDTELSVGDDCVAYVNNVNESGESLWANVSPTLRGRMSRLDVGPELPPIGSAFKCRVLSLEPNLLLTCPGSNTGFAMVHKVAKTYLSVRLSGFRSGIVRAIDTSDCYEPLDHKFQRGQILPAKIIDTDGERIFVTLRPDFEKTSEEPKDLLYLEPPTEGTVLRGYVKNIADSGIFVEIGRDIVGRVQISQISDSYLKDWKHAVQVGQVVQAKVLKAAAGKVELSLKPSVVTGAQAEQPGLDQVTPGQVFDGFVRRVTDFGVFVTLANTHLSGLCHKSEVAEKPLDNLSRVFNVGDPVRVRVLGVDLDKRQISLGMKASYFSMNSDSDSEGESESDAESAEAADHELGSVSVTGSGDELMSIDPADPTDSSSDAEASPSEDSSDNNSADQASGSLSAGFDWDASILGQRQGDSDQSSESDSGSEDEAPRKKRRKETFVEDRTASLAHQLPQSTKDFERLLVASPDSSVLWMNYMAFNLQLGDIDAAREVGHRALKTIGIRQQDDKFNIWIALLNLENSFGTPDTLHRVFREATQYNDALAIYLRMASIFQASDKLNEATEIYSQATKKFGAESLDVWTRYARFLFETGRQDVARELNTRALQQLPRRLHRDFTVQLAKIEFSLGDPERARTLFEALVATNRKRVDLWGIYLDQEIKYSRSRQRVAKLFERVFDDASGVKLTMKQAKYLFKKWLQFEADAGDEQGQEYVKTKAASYVQRKSNQE